MVEDDYLISKWVNEYNNCKGHLCHVQDHKDKGATTIVRRVYGKPCRAPSEVFPSLHVVPKEHVFTRTEFSNGLEGMAPSTAWYCLHTEQRGGI